MVRVEKYGRNIRLLPFLCMLPLVTPSSRHQSQGTSVEAAIALPSGCALQLLGPVGCSCLTESCPPMGEHRRSCQSGLNPCL